MAKGKTMKFTKALERLHLTIPSQVNLTWLSSFHEIVDIKTSFDAAISLKPRQCIYFSRPLGLLAAPFDYLYREARNFKNGTNNILRRNTRYRNQGKFSIKCSKLLAVGGKRHQKLGRHISFCKKIRVYLLFSQTIWFCIRHFELAAF